MKKEENTIANFFEKRKKKVIKSKTTVVKRKNTKKAIKKRAKKTIKRKVESKQALFGKKSIVLNKHKKATNKKKRVTLSGMIGIVSIILFFGTGLFFTGQTFQGINFEKTTSFFLMVALLVILVSLKSLFKKEIKIRKTPLDKIILAFVVLYGVSAWFSVDKWHSFVGFFSDPSRGIMFVVALIIIFYIIVSNFTLELGRKVFGAVVITIVLISIYTLVSGLGLIPQSIQILFPFSFIGSVVSLTVLLSTGIPLLIVAFLELSKNKFAKIAILFRTILVVSLVVIVIDLMMLKNFVAWGGLVIGLVIFIFFFFNEKGKKIEDRVGKIIIITILTTLVLIAGWAKSDYGYLMPVTSKIGLSNELRAGLPISFEIVKNSIFSNPKQALLGSGPATFGYDFAKFYPSNMVSSSASIQYLYQGDGFLTEAIPTIGIIGSILLLIMVVIFIIKIVSVLSSRKKTSIYLVGLFIASIIWLLNAVTGQIDGGILIFGILILSLTMFFALENSTGKSKYYIIAPNGISGTGFFGIVVLLFLITSLGGAVYVAKAYLADTYLKQALSENDTDQRTKKIMKAIRLRPEEGIYYTKLGQASLGLIGEKILSDKEIHKEDVAKMANDIIHYARKSAGLMPSDIMTLRFLASVYETTGAENIQLAQETYKNIIKLEPNNSQYYIKLGDLYLIGATKENKNEEINKAINLYERVLKMNPKASIAHDRMATAYYQKGDLDKAIQNISSAIVLDSKKISYKFALGTLYQVRGSRDDVANAEKIFKLLLKESPQNIDILTQLGLLYEQTGYLDEAKKYYEQILKIVGDDQRFQKIKNIFSGFIENLDNGKLNIKKENVINMTDMTDNKIDDLKDDNKQEETISADENFSTENQSENKNNEQVNEDEKDIITINVDIEGPINVRSEGSLTGDKLTKIKETGEFKKINENDEWIRIIIPASNDSEEIKGWVHKKFVIKK